MLRIDAKMCCMGICAKRLARQSGVLLEGCRVSNFSWRRRIYGRDHWRVAHSDSSNANSSDPNATHTDASESRTARLHD